MIKIDNAKLKEICDEYSDDVAKINRYVGTKKNKYLNYLFCERDFREVISCPPMRFAKEIELFRNKFFPTDYNDKEWLSFKTYMKGQYEKVRKSYLYNVLKSLDIKVCPYCNRQYIFNVDNGRKVSAQFDHFYSKSEYPYLALSFYNLIQCCPTCNKAKGETQIAIQP